MKEEKELKNRKKKNSIELKKVKEVIDIDFYYKQLLLLDKELQDEITKDLSSIGSKKDLMYKIAKRMKEYLLHIESEKDSIGCLYILNIVKRLDINEAIDFVTEKGYRKLFAKQWQENNISSGKPLWIVCYDYNKQMDMIGKTRTEMNEREKVYYIAAYDETISLQGLNKELFEKIYPGYPISDIDFTTILNKDTKGYVVDWTMEFIGLMINKKETK